MVPSNDFAISLSAVFLMSLSGICVALWWFFKQKLEAVTRSIDDLYRLHNEDVVRLAEYKLQIAETHYPKNELNIRFERLDNTIKEGFQELGANFREMTKVLHEHLEQDHRHL